MSKSRNRPFVAVSVALAVAIGGVAWAFVGCRDSGRGQRVIVSSVDGERGSDSPQANRIAPPPADPATRYVGSTACADCHADIAKRYNATHSMARATQTVAEAPVIENAEVDGSASFSPSDQSVYTIARFGRQLTHGETLHDATGQSLYNQTESISYVLGSGRRGRGYIINRQGLLFQSPISWYSQDDKYDLSPGYPASGHRRFHGKISQECLFCHAGQVKLVDAFNDRFAKNAIVEGGIGCERCHGPGEEHVRKERGERKVETAETAQSADATSRHVVNPARLPPAEREAVCYQCHLHSQHIVNRSGRKHSDFHPGRKLEDIWTAFVSRDATKTPALVEQVRASQCFLKSNGELGCISCHDPHERPAPEMRAAYYRERCNTCHADRGCSLPDEERQAAPADGSCMHCHMPPSPMRGLPHTAHTDHRILRDPSLSPAALHEGDAPVESLALFDDADTRLPKAEVDRAWGILLATRAGDSRDRATAERAIDFLDPDRDDPVRGMKRLETDATALFNLGLAYEVTVRNELAAQAWRLALKLEPTNEQILQSLTLSCLQHGDPKVGLAYADRLVAANPHMAEYHWLRARLLERLGRLPEAIVSAERSLAHDPTSLPIRQWLLRAYQKSNQSDKAERLQSLILRWPEDARDASSVR